MVKTKEVWLTPTSDARAERERYVSGEAYDALAAELAELRTEAERNRADAQRYRGLRRHFLTNYPAGIEFRLPNAPFASVDLIEATLDNELNRLK